MNITQEKIDNLNALLKVSIKPEDYQARVEKAIKDQAKKAKIPGFRPGMVPPAHIKKMHGKNILVDEVNALLTDSLNNYLTENKIEVLGQPLPKVDNAKEWNWDNNDEFEFDYELGLAPAFEISFTPADKVTQYDIKIDDETLNARIANIRKSYGKMSNPDVSADGDMLFGELQQLSADGSVFEGGLHNEKASLRLDLVDDEAIKASLIGVAKSDAIRFDIKNAFDDAQISKLLNITVEEADKLNSDFQFTVKNVNRLGESDLNQEFFDKLFGEGAVTTEEGFRTKITEELESMMVQDAEQKLQAELHGFVMQKVNFNLPDEFLKRWLKATNENISEDELESGYADFASNLKWTLIANKIVKENNIEIKYEDVFQTAKHKLDAQFRMYSPQAVPEEQIAQYTVQFLQNKENANRTFEEVKAGKVFEFLQTAITLEKQEIAYNKFAELK